MPEPLRIAEGELHADAIIEALHEGRWIVVTTTVAGGEHEVTLRHDGSTYYCDTPTRLHRHESEAEMRTCIRNMGYGKEATADDK